MSDFYSYVNRISGTKGQYNVDLSFADSISIRSENPFLIVFQITKNNGKASFFSDLRASSAEKKATKICRDRECVFTGKKDYASHAELSFYTRTLEHANETQHLLTKIKKVNNIKVKIDSNWEYYLELYPSEKILQRSMNAKMIDKYKKEGDRILLARNVNFHLSFLQEGDRLAFEAESRLAGFIAGNAYFQAESDMPYWTVVASRSPLDEKIINAKTDTLIGITENKKGEYHYWDCQKIRK